MPQGSGNQRLQPESAESAPESWIVDSLESGLEHGTTNRGNRDSLSIIHAELPLSGEGPGSE